MYEIVIGIPSYNEGPRISFVVEQMDKGLKKYYPDKKAVIVNVDGGSTDDTKESFLNTKTETEKKHLAKDGVSGKGNVFKMLFEFIKENRSKAIIVVDADLKSINPEWVKLMLEPIYKGFDYSTPLYSRHKYDGTITNNIVYPIVYGLYGVNIRQPIGGDFSFSGRIAEYWLEQEWHEGTGQFGIDNFMTTSAILGNFKICQTGLGAKIHKPSAPNLGRMFLEVLDTLFNNTLRSKDFIKDVKEVKDTEIFGIELQPPQDLEVNKEQTKAKAEAGMKEHDDLYKEILPEDVYDGLSVDIDSKRWCKIVFAFLKGFENNNSKEYLEAFSFLYFARVYSFMEETWNLSQEQAEEKIKEQAKLFFKNRELFIF